MATAVEDAILLLADTFERDGCYQHTMHCLRALCTTHTLLPATEVKVRVHLARLLLDHTFDLDQAIHELQIALVTATTLSGTLCWRCEILSLLAKCHRQLGNAKEQLDCLKSGVDLCQHGAHTNDRNELIQWRVCFQTRLANAHLSQGDIAGALQWVDAGLRLAAQQQLHQQQILLLLCRLHLHVIQPGGTAAAAEAVQLLETALVEVRQQPSVSSTFLAQAKLNFNLIQAFMQLRKGELHTLTGSMSDDKAQLTVITKMEELLQHLEGQPPPYEWLPYDLQKATIQLVAANITKNNKVKQALAHIERGRQLVDAYLKGLGLNSSTFGAHIPAAVMFKASTPLLLKLLLLECQVQVYLLQTKLEEARAVLWRCIKLMAGYPFLKTHLGPAVHLLVGMYAHSVGNFQEAALHCHAAVVSWAAMGSHNSATVATCLKILASVEAGEPGAVAAGLDALGPEPASDLGLMELTLTQLTRSILKLRQGHTAEAKALLGKALKITHNKLCSHHVLTNVLILLAPLQLQDNDVAGAEQMSNSSFLLSRSNQDLPVALTAFKVLHAVHKMQEHDPRKLAEEQAYITRKTEAVQAAVSKALENTQQHDSVLQWDLQHPVAP